MILFDQFSNTKAKVLKHSTTRVCVLCVCMLDREGRTLGVSSAAVVLYNMYSSGMDGCVSDRLQCLSDWFP